MKAKVKELKDINTNLQESNEELMQTNQNLRAQVDTQEEQSLDNLTKLSINSPEQSSDITIDQAEINEINEEQASMMLGSDLHKQINN